MNYAHVGPELGPLAKVLGPHLFAELHDRELHLLVRAQLTLLAWRRRFLFDDALGLFGLGARVSVLCARLPDAYRPRHDVARCRRQIVLRLLLVTRRIDGHDLRRLDALEL